MIAYKKLESGDERWLMKVNQTFRGCQISEEKAEAVLQDKKIRVYIQSALIRLLMYCRASTTATRCF